MSGRFGQFAQRLAAPLLALALLGLRAPHLSGPLDDPHSWRQCDTVHYSLDFHRNGIDVLRPAVSWLGDHGTLIFEFPLSEAMSAALYGAFGPDPLWDRAVSLAFFVLSAAYLFAFVRWIAASRVAWLAVLAYLAFPLGQFFSRAAQVDFAAAAFGHALLFHLCVAMKRRSIGHAGAAAAWGVLAALVKAPSIVPVLGPMAVAGLAAWSGTTVALGAAALGIPAIAFVLWRGYVDSVNNAAPDWMFLPGYYKEVNPLWWYLGSWAQRFDLASWVTLAKRIGLHIATPAGAVLALLGLAWRAPAGEGRVSPFGALAYALAWWAMGLVYLLVFFPLNVIHHYYQVPLLGPTALMIALGTDALWRRAPHIGVLQPAPLAFALFLAACLVAPHQLGYYRVDWLRVEAGRMIARYVPPDALIVASDYGATHSDPRLLVRADRSGWPLAIRDLEPARVRQLVGLGARYAAVLTDAEHPQLAPPAFLESGLALRAPVVHDGRALGTLQVYDLTRAVKSADGPAAHASAKGEPDATPHRTTAVN